MSNKLINTKNIKPGDITNKGVVEVIYDEYNLMIDSLYYDLSKHNVKLKKKN